MEMDKKVRRKIKKALAILQHRLFKRTVIYEDDNGVIRIRFGRDFDDVENLASLFDFD